LKDYPAMTLKEHSYWKRCWLRHAAKAVKLRDYLAAADAYRAAAHHEAVIKTAKNVKD